MPLINTYTINRSTTPTQAPSRRERQCAVYALDSRGTSVCRHHRPWDELRLCRTREHRRSVQPTLEAVSRWPSLRRSPLPSRGDN
eukprot:scaffold13135_cov51-Phaeocystis_antarctica.AAC.1